MSETLAITILLTLAGYAILGSVFAAWFLARGIVRIDPAASGSGLWFRLIILPGVIALWPVLVIKARAARGKAGAHGVGDQGRSAEGHA
ncbi:MAG: hypothetical protein KDA05_07305 [Phycisphaerales bacterium]|nr:hypothetical protein [Phycisphaerales bacterium]